MSSISEIIFEHIDEKFAYGKYGDFKVIIMKENKYINATKLCGEHNKRFENWLRNDNSKILIDEVDNELKNSKNGAHSYLSQHKKSLITLQKECKNNLRGTYVHDLLIPHIASWISPNFAIKVSKIVNNFIIKEHRESLKQKDDKIDAQQLADRLGDQQAVECSETKWSFEKTPFCF